MPLDMENFGRDGGSGGRPYSVEDMATLAFFLRGCEIQGVWSEGHSATEAFDAACRIMDLPADDLRSLMDREASK